jgi:hypothetical protein
MCVSLAVASFEVFGRMCIFLLSRMRATCYLYLLPFDLITPTILQPGPWANHILSYSPFNNSGRAFLSLF